MSDSKGEAISLQLLFLYGGAEEARDQSDLSNSPYLIGSDQRDERVTQAFEKCGQAGLLSFESPTLGGLEAS